MKEIKIFLITKNNIGFEYLSAAKSVTKKISKEVNALSIDWNKATSEIREEMEKNVVVSGQKSVILTESFGDTATNFTIPYLKKDVVEIITGINLDMVVRALNFKSEDDNLRNFLNELDKIGKSAIKVLNHRKLTKFDNLLIMGLGRLPYEIYRSFNNNFLKEPKSFVKILSYYTGEEVFEIEEKLRLNIDNFSQKNTLILIDSFYSEELLELLKNISSSSNVAIISGVNFPMLSEAILNLENEKENLIEKIMETGKRNIKIISQLL